MRYDAACAHRCLVLLLLLAATESLVARLLLDLSLTGAVLGVDSSSTLVLANALEYAGCVLLLNGQVNLSEAKLVPFGRDGAADLVLEHQPRGRL